MTRLAILGFGTMGQAITSGLVDSGGLPASEIVVYDKGREKTGLAAALGVGVADSLQEAVRDAEAVLLAVKPKDVAALAASLADDLAHRPLVVSIAAGVTLAHLADVLPDGIPVVRAMPNTPCAIRVGTTVLSAGPGATGEHVATARAFFEPLGAVLELEERHVDAVTSLSASGPAFMFVILESLADGGVQCGLPRSVATELAARMALGAATMVLQSGRHPAALKDDVTTPAGCTSAGLLALEDGRIRSVVARAVERAAQVASGLGE